MSTTTIGVTGLTCGHCVNAVQQEISALDGVTEVTVALEVGGASQVTITSAEPVPADALAAAIDEAGDYEIAG